MPPGMSVRFVEAQYLLPARQLSSAVHILGPLIRLTNGITTAGKYQNKSTTPRLADTMATTFASKEKISPPLVAAYSALAPAELIPSSFSMLDDTINSAASFEMDPPESRATWKTISYYLGHEQRH